MTRTSSCHLIDMLAEVPDPRNKKGKRHPLKSILALVVIGLMCGHNGWTSIATWARAQPTLAKAFGWTHKVQYGRTSLRPEEASAERLLTGQRGHCAIENKVHWVRDVVFREDVSPVRCGAIPQVMAAM